MDRSENTLFSLWEKSQVVFMLLCGLVCVFPFSVKAQTAYTNLPTIYINTFGEVAVTSTENYVYAKLTRVEGDSIANYDSLSIRGRGNSTWGLAKKPYRIKFNEKEKFLGKGYAKAKSWTLLSNMSDKTLIRNAVAFKLGEELGLPFNSVAQPVDFVLNNSFQGSYELSDQMQVGKKRVEITEQEDESNLTGGYFFEIDGFGTSEGTSLTGVPLYFRTNKNLIVSIKSPDDEFLTLNHCNYLRNYLNSFETALFSDDFKDPTVGYRAYVDSATLINWYVATEMTGNVDGFWSTYMYKQADDPKLYFGPLWDYDIAFNNCNRVGDVTNALMMDKGFGTDLTKVWMKRMWADPWFAKAVNTRWKAAIADGLTDHLLQFVDSMATYVDASQKLNFKKWPIQVRAYDEITLYSTYQEGVDYLKKFISEHAAYLTTTFETAEENALAEQASASFVPDNSYFYRILGKGSNKSLDVTDNSLSEGTGIMIWSSLPDEIYQLWEANVVGDYVQFVNRGSGLALYDPASLNGSTYVLGSQLQQIAPDITDARQLWRVVPVNTGDEYNFINKQTNLVMHNAGGSVADGNKVLSYTYDAEKNLTSSNRLWYIQKDTPKAQIGGVGIASPSATEYSVFYNPELQTVRFAADDASLLDVQAQIYTMEGTLRMQFNSSEQADVSELPAGIYIIHWTEGSHVHSIKFVKR
ncbi:MAG: CotH kinase family protein [Bacteroidaceae bacterium]